MLELFAQPPGGLQKHIRPVLPGGAGHVLITTRRGRFGYLGPVLDLDVLFPSYTAH